MHVINILKYLIGASLRRFVMSMDGTVSVDCYAIIGLWIIKAQTAPGGRPHAEVLCFSMLAREKPTEVIVSTLPCINFGKTPPCCYTLLSFCSSLLVLNLDIAQQEAIRFLRCFISIG